MGIGEQKEIGTLNIIVVSYEYPPQISGGAHRPYKFAKELAKRKNKVDVITIERGPICSKQEILSIVPNLTVWRTKYKNDGLFNCIYEKYYFNTIDRTANRWSKYLFKTLAIITKKRKYDAIIVTVPPFSIATLISKIKKKYRLPVILDMRDAWSLWNVAPYATYFHYLKTVYHERSAIKYANYIIVTSSQTKHDLIRQHTSLSENKIEVITNSYEKDISFIPDEVRCDNGNLENYTICYVGSFYFSAKQRFLMLNPWWKKWPYQYLQFVPRKEDWLYRSPYFFFSAVSNLFEHSPKLKKVLRIQFVGKHEEWLMQMINRFDLKENVTLCGDKTHTESLNIQSEADALLITSAKVLGGNDYSIAGKTFEYISHLKPILAFTTDGAQKDIIENTGLGVMCNPDDIEKSSHMIKRLIDGKIKLKPNRDYIKSLHISSTTNRLVRIIRDLNSKR